MYRVELRHTPVAFPLILPQHSHARQFSVEDNRPGPPEILLDWEMAAQSMPEQPEGRARVDRGSKRCMSESPMRPRRKGARHFCRRAFGLKAGE